MISKLELRNDMLRLNDEDTFPFYYDKEDDSLYRKSSSEYVMNMDEFLYIYRKETGQLFESIHLDSLSLLQVLRCLSCGCVIFSFNDENYEPLLRCPVCTDHKTQFDYWTKEDIEKDVDKQRVVQFYEELHESERIREERIKRRKGKYDWEIFKKKFYFKKRYFSIVLECDDITQSYFKGLRLNIHGGDKLENGGYIINKHIFIPLSISQWKYRKYYKN